ncbi:MAG: cobalamin B12-binding domain-containing protein [Erythrobacter sp.]
MAASIGTGMIGAGSAALLKVMSGSLGLRKSPQDENVTENDPLAGDSINSIIEGEIIPRLLMAHSVRAAKSGGGSTIDPTDARRFALLPLRVDAANLMEEVDAFLAEGVSVEAIFLDLLAPAARRLGEMWEADECDFVDVTMGLWRLQEVMRDISARVPMDRAIAPPDASRALFAPMPGDQHYFGPLMLDEIFAREGWKSTVLTKPLRKELLDCLSREAFDVVGLTLSRDCPSAALSNIIKAMRSVSCNPHLSIIVGGRMINQNPAIVAEVGADGTGADARAAFQVAQRLVQSAEVRAHMLK